MNGRRWMLGKAILPTVLAGVALVLAVPLSAGERTRVKFSDSKDAPLLPEGATLSPLPGRSTGPMMNRGSSLSGVSAPPFAPNASSGSGLPLRSRDGETSGSWITRTPEDFSLNEDSLNRAFGVRTYRTDDTKAEGAGVTRSNWDAYRTSRNESGSGTDRTGTELRSDESNRGLSFDRATDRPASISGREGGLAGRTYPGFADRDTVRFSDSVRDAFGNAFSFGDFRERTDLVGQTLGLESATAAGSRLNTLNENGTDRPDRFTGLPTSDGLASDGTVPAGLDPAATAGVLDAVNFQPDLTRREMNPVVGRPATGLGPNNRPLAPDLLTQPTLSVSPTRRDLADTLMPTRSAPPVSTALTPLGEEPRRTFYPHTLPVPRRGF